MSKYQVHIKNMVCPRCINAVKEIFNVLDIDVDNILLGEVLIAEPLTSKKRNQLEIKLKASGFELLKDYKAKVIERIKSLIIEQIHYSNQQLKVNFSTFLADQLNQDYSALSRLFSAVESITIERFITKQKIEKVKELICYKELTFTQIASQMGYSSVAHLSSQFKKETGMTPSIFRKSNRPLRKSLDDL